MKNPPHRSGTSFCEFPIIFSERESGYSKFSREILYEGVRFPLTALSLDHSLRRQTSTLSS